MTWSLPKNYIYPINQLSWIWSQIYFSLNKHVQHPVVQILFKFPPLLYQSMYHVNHESKFFFIYLNKSKTFIKCYFPKIHMEIMNSLLQFFLAKLLEWINKMQPSIGNALLKNNFLHWNGVCIMTSDLSTLQGKF